MAKNEILLLIIALLFLYPAYSDAGWRQVLQIPSDDLFAAIHACNENVVYVAGMTDTPPSRGACVYGTTDGGDHWKFLGPNDTFFLFLGTYFVSPTTGWAGGLSFVTPVVCYTNNGGQSFSSQVPPGPMGASVRDLYFLDRNNGWLVGDGGLLAKTNNAGVNWIQVTPPVPNTEGLNSIHFINRNEGWIVGGHWSEEGAKNPKLAYDPRERMKYRLNGSADKQGWGGVVLRTKNGGATWEAVQTALAPCLYRVWFVNSNVGWVVGETKDDAKILKTTDGGVTFEEQTVPNHSRGKIVGLYGLQFFDENEGWALGGGFLSGTNVPFTAMLHTKNGGATWVSDESYNGNHLIMDASFVNKNLGWACGTELLVIEWNGDVDTTPPYTQGHNPAKGATNVPADTNVYLEVKDTESGVNPDSIVMKINSQVVEPNIGWIFGGYSVNYDPAMPFQPGSVVNVSFVACDKASPPNWMEEETYSFTISGQPQPTATPTPTAQASITPSITATATITPTPSPTPSRERPVIMLAGYFNSYVSSSEGGSITIMAYVPQENVSSVEVYYNGAPTGILLVDDGSKYGDIAGDKIYTFKINNIPAGAPTGRLLLELVAFADNGMQSLPWPYFNVVPKLSSMAGFSSEMDFAEFDVFRLMRMTIDGVSAKGNAPVILAGGYWDSAVSYQQGGTMKLLVAISDPGGATGINRVEIIYEDIPTGILLYDDGNHGDFASKDGVFGVVFNFDPFQIPAGSYLLGVRATNNRGFASDLYPYLTIH